MAEIIRNRTIRPSSRMASSKSYKIDTEAVSSNDTLIVNIDHESLSFQKSYKFSGKDIAYKNSISFRVQEINNSVDISWSGAIPISNSAKISSNIDETAKVIRRPKLENANESSSLKKSFEAIVDSNSKILILGTLPGDESLAKSEYYGNSRNQFWKIIENITNNSTPFSYEQKKQLLLNNKIAIWDVTHSAIRPGSLDSSIIGEVPNEIEKFLNQYTGIKVIGFNGAKAEALFDKYFSRRNVIKYILLPSSSPANASMNFETKCNKWKEILK